MQLLRYTAPSQSSNKRRYQLFSYWQVFCFAIICSTILYFIFPGNSLQAGILSSSDISSPDLYYSLTFLKRNDSGNRLYQLIQTNQAEAVAYIDNVRGKLEKDHRLDELWMNYIVLRSIYFTPNQRSELKKQAKGAMDDYFQIFKIENPNEGQKKLLAKDALAMTNSSLSLFFYERVVQTNPEQSVEFYKQMAHAASWANQCERSAELYFTAQHKTKYLDDMRDSFFSALNALLQCNKPALALELGLKNINGLSEDIETYKKLTGVALQANKTGKAKELMLQLIKLRSRNPE